MKQAVKYMALCMMLGGMTGGLVHAELLAHWTLNEMTGDTAGDASGNGHDGTLIGGPQWVEGKLGGAVAFDGVDDYIDFGNPQDFPAGTDARSMTAWVTTNNLDSGWVAAAAYGSPAGSQAFGFARNGRLLSGFGYGNDVTIADFFETDTWYHLALTYDGATASLYVNGELLAAEDKVWNLILSRAHIGRQINNAAEFWDGIVDDVRIYSHSLSPEEVQDAMIGTPELSAAPVPEDGATDVVRDALLSWTPGRFAVTHDVYFGQVFADVNSADRDSPLDVLVGLDQNANTLDPGRLDFGETYYWRVDEVNGAPDRTIFKGAVWSFSAEPYSIPVDAINASASSANAANMGPEKTIDGSGLNELDQHSTEGTDMWLSATGDQAIWIQYAFDQAYKLHEMQVWNSNQLIEAFVGLGAKEVVVEISLDGENWAQVGDVTTFAQATGSPSYAANTVFDFGGAVAQYVRLNVQSGYGPLGQYGLSEVRFLYIPTLPREPEPADGATTGGVDVALTWRAGREVAAHEVYLGTSVEDLSLIATVGDNGHTASGLTYDTAYVWQIVEVNDAEDPAAYAGPVWRFATPPFAVVDDFEAYDNDCKRIFFAWEDGLGHNGGQDIEDCAVPPSNGNGGGSIVGNASSPFAEQTIVHAGGQSMPYAYDNNFGPSEASLRPVIQDWSAGGIKSLSLYFRGVAGNTGQLYVKLNNTKIVYDGDSGDISAPIWVPWIIDLATTGADLQNVTNLTLGVDGASAAGTLYIDDICLYPRAVEYVTPTAPDDAHLVAHYSLDGTSADVSGQGNDGTENGDPVYGAGVVGQAVQLDGFDDFIDFGNPTNWPVGAEARTLCAWGITSSVEPGWRWLAAYGSPATSQAMFIGINGASLFGGGYGNDVSMPDFWQLDEWSHVALTYDGLTARLYANGIEVVAAAKTWNLVPSRAHIGRQVNDAPEFWQGAVDDVRLYNQALSPAELAWLAGKTAPMVKPF